MRIGLALGIALACHLGATAPATAEPVSQLPTDRAYLTFRCPTRVPGATLAPGTYLFVILRAHGGQLLIDTYTSDGSSRVARFLGIESRRDFGPQGTGGCPATAQPWRGWFHGIGSMGIEFVYGQAEASDIVTATGVRVPYSPVPIDDAELVGAYPVAGLTPFAPLLLVGAGAIVPLPAETTRLGLLVVAAGASFGPQDHLTAARVIVAERAAREPDERALLRQVSALLDRLQRLSRGRDGATIERALQGLEATLTNLRPPTQDLARRGFLPPPRDFIQVIERIDAHLNAFKRARR